MAGSDPSGQAALWQGGTATLLPNLPGSTGTTLTDVSADGSVAVGYASFSGSPTVAVFSQAGALQAIPDASDGKAADRAEAVSADGATVVGRLRFMVELVPGYPELVFEPFVWNGDATTSLGLPSGSGPIDNGHASDVSADGSRIVGFASIAPWLFASGGFLALPLASATGISPEGDVVVGSFATAGPGNDAGAWNASGGLQSLGTPSGIGSAQPLAASFQGEVVVGSARALNQFGNPTGPFLTFIWDAQGGNRLLEDYIGNELGLDIAGWQLDAVGGISDDGQTIVGSGLNPGGVREGWVLAVPEPGARPLLVSGLLTLAGLARRRIVAQRDLHRSSG